eukprot:TRINITY_DN1827_c0_g1_i4.p1 TRINITY_DN1827_c0_g1~~TRINITY_DN1827_c0_g1_i4.p1  ORF type:complete len:141 (-),score=48.02 TRINITY_DN1827_c0_g1_i4:32-454(-)
MQQEIQHWVLKFDQDLQTKDQELEELKTQRSADLIRLSDNQKKFKEAEGLLEEEERSQQKRIEEEMLKKLQNEAAFSIQLAWREFLAKKKSKRRRRRRKGAGRGRRRRSTRSRGRSNSRSPRRARSSGRRSGASSSSRRG